MNNTIPITHAHILIIGINNRFNRKQILLIKQPNNKWNLPEYITNDTTNLDSIIQKMCSNLTNIENIQMDKINTFVLTENDQQIEHVIYLGIVPMATTYTRNSDELWFDTTFDETLTDYENIKQKIEFFDTNYHNQNPNENYINLGSLTAYALIHIYHNVIYINDFILRFLPKQFTLPDLQRVHEIITTINIPIPELQTLYKDYLMAQRSLIRPMVAYDGPSPTHNGYLTAYTHT